MKATAEIPAKWMWHHRALSRLRRTLERDREELAAAFRQPIDHGGEDALDVAEDQKEHFELLAKLRAEEAELAEVDAAIGRIQKGTYGFCEATGEPISEARLRALPWTRLSAEAAARFEQGRRRAEGGARKTGRTRNEREEEE